MGKKFIFTMVNTISYEIDSEMLKEVHNLKDGLNNGAIKIVNHDTLLINPDGTRHSEGKDIETIKKAIEYGLKEKG